MVFAVTVIDVAIVERVHEVKADVARNQIEARRTPAAAFCSCLGLGQRGSFPSAICQLSNH